MSGGGSEAYINAFIVAEVSMLPNGSVLERLQSAVLASFSRDELRQAVQFVTGQGLEAITPDRPLEVQVYDLLTWAERRGCLLPLVRRLRELRPQHLELRAAAEGAELAAEGAEAPGEAPPEVPGEVSAPVSAQVRAEVRGEAGAGGGRGGRLEAGGGLAAPGARPGLRPGARRAPLHKPLRAQRFIGRGAELQRLLDGLWPGRTVTLCGPGGIGKTALAAEAIWTLAPGVEAPARFPDGVFFHTFYRQPEAHLALAAIARAFGVDPRPTPRVAAQQALAGKQALIVLDGAEAADDLEAVLAVMGSCGVIVTTRRHADAPADYQDLEPLPREESLDLLCAWAGPYAYDGPDAPGEPRAGGGLAAANEMVRLLGGLPLALFLAGRYLAQRRQQAPEFTAWLDQTGLDALHFADRPSKSIPLLMAASLQEVSEAARAAFGIVGVLALWPFDAAAVAAGLEGSLPETHQALGELVDYGLLLRPDELYQVTHALAHAYARAHLQPKTPVVERLAHYYGRLAQEQTAAGRPGFAVLDQQRPHIVAVQGAALRAALWDAVRRITWKLREYLDLKGYVYHRQIVVQAGLEAARAARDRYDEGQFTNELGLVHTSLGEHRRAADLYVQALAIAREIGDREGEGNALGNLGLAYAALGETQKAIELYEQALALDRAIGDRRGEGADLGNLGLAYYALGETRKAIELHGQRLGIAREIGDRRGEAIALGNLGNAYAALGETQKAIELYEQHLVITREIGDRQGEAIGSWNLGEAYEREGDLLRAVECMAVCVAYEVEIGHPDAEGDARRVEEVRARGEF